MKIGLRILVLSIAIIICGAVSTQSQPWRYFQPEKDFQIGAVGLTWAKTAMDTLGIFFSRDYYIHPTDLWRLHLDPAIDTTNTNIWNWHNTYTRYAWRNYTTIKHGPDSVRYRVVGALAGLTGITRGMYCLENYPDYSDEVQALPMDSILPSMSRDSIMHDLIYPVKLTKLSSRHDTMMVAGPTYTEGFGFKRGYKALYQALGDSDRSTFFRFSYALHIGDINAGLTTDTVAYAILYNRNRKAQSDCHCNVYTPFDTFYIRRSEIDSGKLVDPENGYREYGKTIKLSVGNIVYKHDSIVFERRYDDTGKWIQDTITSRDTLYNRDTVVGYNYGTRYKYTIYVKSATRRDSVVEIYDSVEITRVPLYVPRERDYAYGNASNWFGWGTNTTPCIDYCDSLLSNNVFPAGSIDDPIRESDLQMRFFTTRIADVTFARMRINQDLYDSLRNGVLDSLIQVEVDSLYAHGFDSIVTRIAYDDEIVNGRYRTGAYMSRAVQNAFRANGDTVRQLFQNPTSNFDGFRLFSEDLDTTSVKLVQIMIRQDYQTWGPDTPIPLFYARLDNMDSIMWYTLFRAKDTMTRKIVYCRKEGGTTYYDTVNQTDVRPVMIVYNKLDQYRAYDSTFQLAFGKYLDSKGIASTVVGPFVPRTARAVDVARFKYPKNGPACPVWVMIEPRGWINEVTGDEQVRCEPGGRWQPHWAQPSPPTPELISAQVWLAINCSVNGYIYSDGVWDGSQFGYINAYTGDHTQEYDTLEMPNRTTLKPDSLGFTFPKMWVGFNSRFNIMARVNKDVLKLDKLIHLSQLDFRGHQMSVFDDNQYFTDMPLIDSLYTRHSQRLYRTSDSTPYQVRDSSAVDPKNETYLEVTHWQPAPMDTAALRSQCSYVLFTNRRVYPVDTIKYGPIARLYGADSTGPGGTYRLGDSMGLGFIDARRPVLYLKNSTSVVADSFLVEKVLDTSWRRTVAVHCAEGDTVALDFLMPGWGEMYKFTPIPIGISQRGVAWNNSVHAENIGCAIPDAPSVVVYERDSIVYIRKFQYGCWSSEIMLSDAVDTTKLDSAHGFARRGYNYFPAIASVRNPNVFDPENPVQSMFAVWEHQESDGKHMVQGSRIDNIFSDWEDVPDVLVRYNLTQLDTMPSGINHTPSVTGVIDGYLVSWAKHKFGVSLMAVRDLYVNPPGMPDFRDTMGIHRLFSKFALDSIVRDSVTRYPTLASVPLWRLLLLNDTVSTRNVTEDWVNGPTEGDVWTTGSVPAAMEPYWIGNLAYQQGSTSESSGQQIVHHLAGVQFLPLEPSGAKIRMAVMKPEHVSIQLPECNFVHPSIAADSVRVGVSFETVGQTYRTITLRFRDVRDSSGIWVSLPTGKKPFTTPAYRWGDYHIMRVGPKLSWLTPNTYIRPSVTHFPSLDSIELTTYARGALVWQWSDAPSPGANGVMMYRYGTAKPIRIQDGQDASMVFAPYITGNLTTLYDATGVLRRGRDGVKFMRRRDFGDTISRWYYPLSIDSVYPRSNALLSSGETGRILSYFTASRKVSPSYTQCLRPDAHVNIGIFIKNPAREPDPDHRRDTNEFHSSPKFFGPTLNGNTWTTTIPEVAEVARTSVFAAPDTNVTLDIRVIGADSLVTWLNTQPYDSTMMHPADIGAVVELIRVSDSTVRWRSDTIWARTADDSVLVETVVLPLDTATTSGTHVFARLRPIATEDLDIEYSAGFFFPDSVVQSVAPKRVIQHRTASGDGGEKLSLSVVPNPATGASADIVVSVWHQGTVTVSVYDAKGDKILDVDQFQPDAAGEYVAPIDLKGLRNGVYIVVAEQNGRRVSTKMPIVR